MNKDLNYQTSITEIPTCQKLLLSIKECCELTGIGENKFYELIRKRLITPMKLGKKGYKVRPGELARFLDEYQGYDLSDLNHIEKIQGFNDLEVN